MLYDKKKVTVAYRCPICGGSVYGMEGLFAVSGDYLRLRCPCGKSELTVRYESDGKARLNVPCVTCPTPHQFVIDPEKLEDTGRAIVLPCRLTGLETCLIGTKDEVVRAMDRANETLRRVMEEAGLENIADLCAAEDEIPEYDPQLTDTVRYMITELNEEGRIHCRCQNNALARYDFSLDDGVLTVFCEECDAEVKMPLFGAGMAQDLIDLDELNLQ